MKESFTVRMDDLVVRPVACRAPPGAHGLRDGFGRLGRSFRLDAGVGRWSWSDDVERVCKQRPARLGFSQRHRNAARAAGGAAPAIAGGRRAAFVIPMPPKRPPPSRGPPRSSAGLYDRSRAGASGSRSSLLHARLIHARLRYARLTHVGPIHVSPIPVSPIHVSPIHARGRHGRKQSSAQAGQRSPRPLPRSALPTPDARSCRRLNLSTMAED